MDDTKDFKGWFGLKERLHASSHLPPWFKEGEIWWCHVGENVGVEINGKNQGFIRPVIVFKKYNGHSFLGLPVTTKLKKGSWYADIFSRDRVRVANLAQGRVFDRRRLLVKQAELSEAVFRSISRRYIELHAQKINLSPREGESRG